MVNKKKMVASVQGRVQGVGFRYFVMQEVRNMPISGYVKNMQDGTVEVVAEGDENQLKRLIEALGTGPDYSRVDTCCVQWLPFENSFNNFQMKV